MVLDKENMKEAGMNYKQRLEDLKKFCKCSNSICVSRRNNKLRELKEEIKVKCDDMGLFCEQSKKEYSRLKNLIKEIDASLGQGDGGSK